MLLVHYINQNIIQKSEKKIVMVIIYYKIVVRLSLQDGAIT